MRRKAVALAVPACVVALAATPLALAGPGGISPPDAKTSSGEAINQLYWFVFAICAVVFVLVEAALVLFVIRFRRRRATAADAEGPQIHGNTRLEIIWTIIPALILVAVAVVVFIRVPTVEATDGSERGEALAIRVEAHQFYWQYEYPDGVVSVDRLVLPVGELVELRITSFDVEHSWWVPELTGKRDAIPGRTTTLRFRPTEEGTFEGKCAELCGALHPVMPTDVEVVSAAAYERWLSEQADQRSGEARAALGRATWEGVCADCHGAEGEGDYGPAIARSGTLTNREAMAELVRNGQNTPDTEGYMPPVGLGWPAFQLDALIAYIESTPALAPEGGQDGG
ncbi:MAG TPA: cytochrome c oxidase subunit II [Gaiellaceae bacterium]|nr:cytochrome c oxidase subunit II [Gaiellaceae bacterium]